MGGAFAGAPSVLAPMVAGKLKRLRCLRGALPPVLFLAVFFDLTILLEENVLLSKRERRKMREEVVDEREDEGEDEGTR